MHPNASLSPMESSAKSMASAAHELDPCVPVYGAPPAFHEGVVAPEVAKKTPLLIGTYVQQEQHAVWRGQWGMSDAAFGPEGLTSPFEMKSMEAVNVQLCTGSPKSVHPAFQQQLLVRSSSDSTANGDGISPVWYGYASKQLGEAPAPIPFDGSYQGFFHIQAGKSKVNTVTERDVTLRFVHDVANPTRFLVFGHGENRFGPFLLYGAMLKSTMELRVYKVYQPKEKEKRVLPRRARTPRVSVAPSISATSSQASTPKSVNDTEVPSSDAQSTRPSIPLARGRSERKRSLPARLRDDLGSDGDAAALKKCFTILKTLMANPKAGPFLAPVDPIALGLPDYFKVVKQPMDLGTVRSNFENNVYKDPVEMVDHVRRTFDNAMLYNAAHSQVHIFAHKLLEDFEKRIKTLYQKSPNGALTPRGFSSMNSSAATTPSSSMSTSTKSRKKWATDTGGSTRKVRGGRGTKGNTKRSSIVTPNQELIMSLKADIERLTAKLEQIQQPKGNGSTTPKTARTASARPFKMDDLTEAELNQPMSQMEKARLSSDLRRLPQDKINRVLQIIAEAVPVAQLTNEYDEVELDINAFDTRCLRMLEGYLRENGIGRKRKRPTSSAANPVKKPRGHHASSMGSGSGSGASTPSGNRLSSAKLAAANIQSRKEQLVHQLAVMENGGRDTHAVDQDVGMTDADHPDDEDEDNASGSGRSGSSSSESDSDSDSEMETTSHATVSDPVIW